MLITSWRPHKRFFMHHAVEGVLKGYDQLLNLVLDETVEYARGE